MDLGKLKYIFMNSNNLIEIKKCIDKSLSLLDILVAKSPDYDVYESIKNQLIFISEKLKNKSIPTQEEKDSIDIGLIAVRELENIDIKEVTTLCPLLHKINYFFDNITTATYH